MGSKSLKPRKTHSQCLYEWRLRKGRLETFDLSWPCFTPVDKLPSGFEMSAHREVAKIFKSMGVR